MKTEQFIRYILDTLITIIICLSFNLFFNIDITNLLLILMFLQIVIYRQIIFKINNLNMTKLTMAISTIIFMGLYSFYETHGLGLFIFGTQIILINYFDSKEIRKIYYEKMMKKICIVLLPIFVLKSFIYGELSERVEQMYIVSLVIFLLLLRNARSYKNRIEKNNEKKRILELALILFLMLNEKMYSFCFSFFRSVVKIIFSVFEFIIEVVFYPFTGVMDVSKIDITDYLQSLKGTDTQKEMMDYINKNNTYVEGSVKDIIFKAIMVLTVAIVLFIIVKKLVKNVPKKVLDESNNEVIIREKINNKHQKFKTKLYEGKGNRVIVKKLFYKIQRGLKKKNFLKESYTATEVVDQVNQCSNYVSSIYNKAKFSKDLITDEEVERMKNECKNIK